MSLGSIPEAIARLREGKPVVVVDDESRENEGDIVLAAATASQEWIAWTVRYSSGFLCAPMTNEIADRLDLPVMVPDNQDPRGTNYTVSVDAADRLSTGISAADRAHTLRTLADPASTPARLNRPGHVMPLRALDGGVRERSGHTEASVELLLLAGLQPVAAIGEMVADDGEMMRLPALIAFGERENVPVVTIEALLRYLDERDAVDAASTAGAQHAASTADAPAPEREAAAPAAPRPAAPHPDASRVIFEVETSIPTSHGPFRVRAYRDRTTGADHVALIAGEVREGGLVRVHSECLTGEAFGSLKCECGPQLAASLDTIQADGGIVIYLRGHEGRGIGLINKLRAYSLQERGLDTIDANLQLGLPADARDYGAAAAILADLGVSSVRLLTNNPDKVAQLRTHGVDVLERVPLIVGLGAFNEGYLDTKRDRMGHLLGVRGDDTSDSDAEATAFAAQITTEGHQA